MRKYKYLNNEDVHGRDVAYNARNISTKYVFQQSSLDIYYLVCDTVDEFYVYYSTKRPCSRMFSEVINDRFSPQKFKLDIDGRIGASEMAYVLKAIRRIFRRLTSVKPELLVYDISTSHHVVVTNICFPSAFCCEMLASAVYERVSRRHPEVASLIDVAVYKRIQMFRIEGSTKYAQRRWKYIAGTRGLSSLETFKKGIISYVDDCHRVSGDRVIDVMLETGIYQPAEHRSGESQQPYCVGRGGIPRGPGEVALDTTLGEFVVRKRVGNLIVLDRIAPSFCNICKRVHDRDGAYIVGGRLFCRRAQR